MTTPDLPVELADVDALRSHAQQLEADNARLRHHLGIIRDLAAYARPGTHADTILAVLTRAQAALRGDQPTTDQPQETP